MNTHFHRSGRKGAPRARRTTTTLATSATSVILALGLAVGANAQVIEPTRAASVNPYGVNGLS